MNSPNNKHRCAALTGSSLRASSEIPWTSGKTANSGTQGAKVAAASGQKICS